MKLNDLMPNEGSTKKRKRVGHGPAAGQGKTSGRGTKGQASRVGEGPRLYHQGGNLPFFRRLPFMRGEGFTPINRVEYAEVNLVSLEKFAANAEITPETLVEAAIVRNVKAPIVLLGRGEVNVPLKVRLHRVSKSARAKIEAAGGTVETI